MTKPERVAKLEEALKLNSNEREMHMTMNEVDTKFQENMVNWTWTGTPNSAKSSRGSSTSG